MYKLVEEKRINDEYREVYAYALEKMLAGIGNAILLLLTALIFDIGIETIVFLSFYIPIRKYAGGLHAKTRTSCVMISLIVMVTCMKLAMVISNTSMWSCISLITLFIVILLINQFAPMDSINKRLSSKNWIKHKIISKYITVVESLILIGGILFVPDLKVYIMTATMAMLLVGITIIPYKKLWRV
jgi:accessory gene regulator B